MAFLNFGKKKLDDKHSRDNAPANDDALDNVESNDNTSGDETKNIKEVDDVENNTALSDDDAEVLLPPEPELSPPVHGIINGVSYWGFSQRGESHIANGAPCQDRCVIDVINSSPLIVAAIADGVGSCMLSHYGAARATRSAVDYLKEKLVNHRRSLDDAFVGDLLRVAMNCAYEAVREEAEELEQLEYSFQSTLTLAIYDGSTLFFSHAGDDGIVAILEDGRMGLATVRQKGEEASSVMPLQSQVWETRKTPNVNAFIMATDGVLDAFVRGEKEGNRIYYPFIEPAVKPGQLTESKVKEVADFYFKHMEGAEYRASVTDDLTMVVVTNQKRLKESNLPKFDKEAWDKFSAEREAQIKAALYPATEPPKKKDKKNPQMSYSNGNWELSNVNTSTDSEEEYCRYCGKKIENSAKFCSECGASLINPYKTNPMHNTPLHGSGYRTETQGSIQVPNITRRSETKYSKDSYPTNKSKKNDVQYSRKSNKTHDYDYDIDEDRWEQGVDPLAVLLGAIFMVMLFALYTILH